MHCGCGPFSRHLCYLLCVLSFSGYGCPVLCPKDLLGFLFRPPCISTGLPQTSIRVCRSRLFAPDLPGLFSVEHTIDLLSERSFPLLRPHGPETCFLNSL